MPQVIHPSSKPIAVGLARQKRKHTSGPANNYQERCRARRLKPCPSAVSIIESRSKKKSTGGRRVIKSTRSSRSLGTVEMFIREKRKQERLKQIDAATGTKYYQRYMQHRDKFKQEKLNGTRKSHKGKVKNKFNCIIL